MDHLDAGDEADRPLDAVVGNEQMVTWLGERASGRIGIDGVVEEAPGGGDSYIVADSERAYVHVPDSRLATERWYVRRLANCS